MTSIDTKNKIPRQSEEFSEFIGERPQFLLKWGLTILFFIFVGLLSATLLINYPEKVFAEATIRSLDSPKKVLAFNQGKVVKVLIGDNSLVHQGEIVGYLESTASHEEVIYLAKVIDSLQKLVKENNFEGLAWSLEHSQLQSTLFGELQKANKTFMEAFDELRDYLRGGSISGKREILTKNLKSNRILLSVLELQRNLQTQDVAIADENFRVSDTLHRDSFISNFEHRAQRSQLIGKKLAIPNTDIAILKNQQETNNVEKQLFELDTEIIQKQKEFARALNVYAVEIEEWKKRFLLISPTSGKLVYLGFLEKNQELKENELIGYVVNENITCYAEMYISQQNIGEILPGQRVSLKFPSYPYFEYGSLAGEIQTIKSISSDNGYFAKVRISPHLNSNLRKLVELKEGLKANAEIIVKDGKLIDRLLNKF